MRSCLVRVAAAGSLLAAAFASVPEAAAAPLPSPNNEFRLVVDTWGETRGGAYPPETSSHGYYSDEGRDGILMSRSVDAGLYTVSNGFMRWDTRTLPDDADIISATVTFNILGVNRTDDTLLSAGWYHDGIIGSLDYTSTPEYSAIPGIPLDLLVNDGNTQSITLDNARRNVQTTGYTGLRLHVAGDQPTGRNDILIESFEQSVPNSAVLYVNFVGPGGKIGSLRFRTAKLAPIGFNRSGVVQDAHTWAHSTRPPPFQRFGGTDCTNFVSQTWHFGGGIAMRNQWYVRTNPLWVQAVTGKARSYGYPWVHSQTFAEHMVNERQIASFWIAKPSRDHHPGNRGDAILYDWGHGAGWSHLAVAVGWDAYGDYIDQHSGDRYAYPWNYGYRIERNPQVRLKMRAVVVHVHAQGDTW